MSKAWDSSGTGSPPQRQAAAAVVLSLYAGHSHVCACSPLLSPLSLREQRPHLIHSPSSFSAVRPGAMAALAIFIKDKLILLCRGITHSCSLATT